MRYTPEQEQAIAQYQQGVPVQQLPQPDVPITRDSQFMNNLFDFKQQMLAPLIHLWKGENEISPGEWELPEGDKSLAIMNQKGITWASGFIADFTNPVYVLSNYDEDAMNDTMRKVVHSIWNTLAKKYKEYELEEIHIQKIALSIWSKVHAILLAARGEGLRRFLTSTYNIDEIKHTTNQMPQTKRQGWGLFSKQPQQPMPPPGAY